MPVQQLSSPQGDRETKIQTLSVYWMSRLDADLFTAYLLTF